MHSDRFPFGVLTVPWYLCGAALAIWAFGPLYIYDFAFVAEKNGWGRNSVGAQDLAGYMGFGFVTLFTLASAVALAFVHRESFRLSLPAPRDIAVPFVISTLIFAIPYVAVFTFYEKHRGQLPYDGNWAAISGICTVGFGHFVVMTALAKRLRAPDAGDEMQHRR